MRKGDLRLKRWAYISQILLGQISIQSTGEKRKLMFCFEKDFLYSVFNIKVEHSENIVQCHIPVWFVGVHTRSGHGVQGGALELGHMPLSLSEPPFGFFRVWEDSFI